MDLASTWLVAHAAIAGVTRRRAEHRRPPRGCHDGELLPDQPQLPARRRPLEQARRPRRPLGGGGKAESPLE